MNIAIGLGAGYTLVDGDNNILIGRGVDVPSPHTCNYVSLWNVVIVRNSPRFVAFVRPFAMWLYRHKLSKITTGRNNVTLA